jgi:BirA family transcriptional regulator, biotin operon repressor / biotin---[acetyl-CoA-carboxylase] ligase
VDPTVWRVEHFDEIDSTNTYVRDRADQPEGLVALADFQTAGRGRMERSWVSPARSSLLCSILLKPDCSPDQLQLVVALVAMSARSALERLSGLRADLKWPNDLVVGGDKLAGLLTEIVSVDNQLSVVVGIGVNLTFEGPTDVAGTSVLAQTGLTIAPRALLDILLEEIDFRRALLNDGEGRLALRSQYIGALATIGQHVRVEQADETLRGLAVGVDDEGRLRVDIDGVVRTFSVGDVVHVRAEEETP